MVKRILLSIKDKSRKVIISLLIIQITILSIIQNIALFYVYAETVLYPPSEVIGDLFVYEAWNREYCSDGNWSQGTNQRALYDQYYVPNKTSAFNEHGLGVINGYYVVACGQAIGEVGDRIDFIYESGYKFECIMGDAKRVGDGKGDSGEIGRWSDNNGRNVIEFMVDYNAFGGYAGTNPNPGSWCFPGWKGEDNEKIAKIINYGPYDGFSKSSQTSGSSISAYDIDADYVDLDVREFKFSGLPKTVSYEGYTNPIANLFKNLGRLLDLLMGLLINGLKRVIIGWTRIIEIMVNYVFYKTEQTMVETPGNDTGE
jgi:hypothetical protein